MESSSSPTRPERKASVFVRLTNKDDKTQIEQIHSVVNKAYRSEGGWTTEAHLISDERIKVEELAEIMEDTKNPLFIAFDSENGQPLGTLQLEPAEYYLDHGEYKKEGYSPTYIESLPKDQQVFLGLFSVDPSQQSRGIGRKLVEAALKHAREDMKRTQCVVNVLYMRDELINWYKKLGFVDHGEKVPFLEESRILQEDTHFSVLRLTL